MDMANAEKSSHLSEVKLALAKKYENLARITKSRPRKRKLRNRVAELLRQAKEAARS
jgi:phage regulator Rha-like protein